MPLVEAASVMQSTRARGVIARRSSANEKAPKAPTAAASVGENQPRYMPPITTAKRSTTTQMLSERTPALPGCQWCTRRPEFGSMRVCAAIASMHSVVPRRPGSSAATDSAPIDCAVRSP